MITESEIEVAKKCGYLPAGNYVVEEVQERYGVDPRRFPKMFKIWKHGHVSLTEYAREVQKRLSEVCRQNWRAIGIGN
jgi:hypothetical protein